MKKLFAKFGLNNKETDTFLKMLELGANPASTIAKNLDIPRPTVYLILEKLREKQLIEVFDKFGVKYFKAISPKDLFNILERQKSDIELTEQILSKKLEVLNKLENKLSITPKVKFYERSREVENLYANILKEKHEFCAIFHPYFVKKFMPKFHFVIPQTLKKNKIPAREMLINCDEAHEYLEKFSSSTHQIKILPKTMNFPSDTIISGNKIFMIAYDKSNISATEIWSKPLAVTQQMIFDQLWENTNI